MNSDIIYCRLSQICIQLIFNSNSYYTNTKIKAMAAEIITKEDLQEFGNNLLNQIRGLLGQTLQEPKRWLKTYQVKNLLKISDNTLQTLRDNGTIPFSKIGGILYYNYEDINRLLSGEVKSKRIKIGKQSNAA